MKSAGKARSNGLYRHIRTSKEIIRNLLNDYIEKPTYRVSSLLTSSLKSFSQSKKMNHNHYNHSQKHKPFKNHYA